jgi:hypothetical protein
LFVIDAGKCFGPPPPGETLLQNGDCTAKGILDTEVWSRHFATQSPLAAAVRNTFIIIIIIIICMD